MTIGLFALKLKQNTNPQTFIKKIITDAGTKALNLIKNLEECPENLVDWMMNKIDPHINIEKNNVKENQKGNKHTMINFNVRDHFRSKFQPNTYGSFKQNQATLPQSQSLTAIISPTYLQNQIKLSRF